MTLIWLFGIPTAQFIALYFYKRTRAFKNRKFALYIITISISTFICFKFHLFLDDINTDCMNGDILLSSEMPSEFVCSFLPEYKPGAGHIGTWLGVLLLICLSPLSFWLIFRSAKSRDQEIVLRKPLERTVDRS